MTEFDKSELRRLDGALLLIFLSLMRYRKAAAVARELNMTASTVSHALQRLRDIFGDPLFLRRPHGLEPTAFAAGLEPLVREAMEILERALQDPAPFYPAESDAVVRIGAPDLDLATLAPPLIARLLKVAPRMRVIARATERQAALTALSNGEVDLLVGFYPVLPPEFEGRAIVEDGYAVVSRPGVFSGPEISLAAYARAHHILVSPAGDLRGFVDDALAERGFERTIVSSVPAFFAALVLVAEGPFVTTVPRRFATAFAPALGLEVRDPPLPLRRLTTSVIRHRRDMRNSMIDWLEDQITEVLQSRVA